MKTQIKIGIGGVRDSIQWIFRFLIIAIIFILYFKIYKVNPFFVQVSSGILFLISVLIQDVYLVITDDYLIFKKVIFFNLITLNKRFKLIDVKDIVVYGHFNQVIKIADLLFPYVDHNYYNQLRLIMKNGDVKTIYTSIYIDDLEKFGIILSEAIEKKNTPLSFNQPSYKEE
jgi:hypothetical protein